MLINCGNLKDWLGYKQQADVERWLTEHGIRFWRGRGGEPVTTLEEIDRRLRDADAPVEIEF